VLLDLNLPATSGHAVLEEAYGDFANACLIKPVDPGEFAGRIQSFAEFWVSNVALPPNAR
jgi:DNA-binding response OmpR family regulator